MQKVTNDEDYFLNKGASILDKYPKLKYVKCFSKKEFELASDFSVEEWSAICKYVVYRIDRESPAAQLSDEIQSMELAAKKAYLPERIWAMIENEEDDILFIHQMSVEFLMLVADYHMAELISIRGILRKIMLSSIAPNMEMKEGSRNDATHHATMVKSIKEFEGLSARAKELEEEVFGLQPEKEKAKGKMWAMAGASELRAKNSLWDK